MWAKALLTALALCADSLAVSAAATLHSRMSWSRGLLMALVFTLCQGGLPLAGALLGSAFEGFVAAIDHWIAFSLLAFVGGRMIFEAFSNRPPDRRTDFSSIRMLFVMGLATSIDAFVVGVGFGLSMSRKEIVMMIVTIGIATFFVTMAGFLLGRLRVAIKERWASTIAGVVLILLGVQTLIEHLISE